MRKDLLLVFVPGLLGYFVSSQCRIRSSSGDQVKVRPPSYAFRAIWPVLYGCLGVSWLLTSRSLGNQRRRVLSHLSYGSTTALLAAFIYLHGCRNKKKEATWTIVGSIGTTISSMIFGTAISRLLLAPLLSWLNFALLLSTLNLQIVS